MHLAWFDGSGHEQSQVAAPGGYQSVRLSPDGTSILFDRTQERVGTFDVWVRDLARGTENRITTAADSETLPIWLPGETETVYASSVGGTLHVVRQRLGDTVAVDLPSNATAYQQLPVDVSPDGRTLLFAERPPNRSWGLFARQLSGGPATPLGAGAFDELEARYSPDGHAVALVSNKGGAYDVYVAPVDAPSQRIRVSTAGGHLPRWSRTGRSLFFVSADNRLFTMTVQTTPAIAVGEPKELFKLTAGWLDFDVSRDGRFLAVVAPITGAGAVPLNVVVNWPASVAR
jgi:TolB protein